MAYTLYKHLFTLLVFCLTAFVLNGQSLQDLNKLRNEYEKFKKEKISTNERSVSGNQSLQSNTMRNNLIPFNRKFSTSSDSLIPSNKYFGYSFFNRSDTLFYWENLPAPIDYVIGPGDEVIVSLWGATQLRLEYNVDKDGKIYDEKVGILFISGKTLNEAENYVLNEFSKVYSTLRTGNPSSFLDLSLGKLKSVNVNFVGELIHPGLYPLNTFSNLITALIQIGGIDTTGSLRNIVIKRENNESVNVDLYDYLLKGNLPENIHLRDKDLVFVAPRLSTVHICSSVVRPGIYESREGESVKDLITFSGGLSANASSVIGLSRIVPIEKRKNKKIFNENYYIEYSQSDSFKVQNGDIITVKSIPRFESSVEIIGQVKKPGQYYFKQGMTIKDLIDLSGGLNDSTFLKSVFQEKAEIIRRDAKNPFEKVIPVNLKNLLTDDSMDINLQNLDRFIIHANPNYFKKTNVQIIGEVKIPGSYPITSKGETLNSLLSRAGGLTDKALDNGVTIFRDKKFSGEEIKVQDRYNTMSSNSLNDDQNEYEQIVKNEYINSVNNEKKEKWIKVAWKNKNVPLMPGDSVVVRQSSGTVNVYGEVYNPGLIEYHKGKNINYYLDLVGGPTLNGSSKNVIVIYANGEVVPNKFLSRPEIKDGSTILVNKKQYREPFKLTEFTSSVLSIISTTVTILVLSQQLSNN
tara:strand:+ start:425 stop:2494 length:2070 start_codon:yes stop_codon:yes gene_type:complete